MTSCARFFGYGLIVAIYARGTIICLSKNDDDTLSFNEFKLKNSHIKTFCTKVGQKIIKSIFAM